MSVQVEVTSCLQNLVFIVVLRNPTWHGARCQVQLSLRRFLRSFTALSGNTNKVVSGHGKFHEGVKLSPLSCLGCAT